MMPLPTTSSVSSCFSSRRSELASPDPDYLRVGDIGRTAVANLLRRFGLEFRPVDTGRTIPGSFWGEPEAGILGEAVYARDDTPLHSLLHETAHLVCMTPERRAANRGDAGSDDLEEAAVCFLQIALADFLPAAGRSRLMRDMDAWGYSFRLGSTAKWFANDADDARRFLICRGLLTAGGVPTWSLRCGA